MRNCFEDSADIGRPEASPRCLAELALDLGSRHPVLGSALRLIAAHGEYPAGFRMSFDDSLYPGQPRIAEEFHPLQREALQIGVVVAFGLELIDPQFAVVQDNRRGVVNGAGRFPLASDGAPVRIGVKRCLAQMNAQPAHAIGLKIMLLHQLEQRADDPLIGCRGGPGPKRDLLQFPALSQLRRCRIAWAATAIGEIEPAVRRGEKLASRYEVLFGQQRRHKTGERAPSRSAMASAGETTTGCRWVAVGR